MYIVDTYDKITYLLIPTVLLIIIIILIFSDIIDTTYITLNRYNITLYAIAIDRVFYVYCTLDIMSVY